MLTWVWSKPPSTADAFCADYDYDQATMSDHLLSGPGRVPEGAGLAVFNGKRYPSSRIRRYGSLITLGRNLVIHERLIPVLARELPTEQYQLYPVTVIAKGGERINEFLAILPLNEVTCTDVEKSEITGWLGPKFVGKVAVNYKSLAHLPGCLGKLDFARDSITGLMIVSDRFKLALEATKEPGLYFKQPEDMQTWMH